MGVIGKAKAGLKKLGKANPREIAKKVGKVAHSVISVADKALSKVEGVAEKIGNIPVVGDMAKQLVQAPLIKGMSAQQLFQGAKAGVNVAKRAEGKAQTMIAKLPEGNIEQIGRKMFSNRPVANIGNSHLQNVRNNAKMINDVISQGGKHPVIQSRLKGLTKHLQSQAIMDATPSSQVPKTVRHITRRQVMSGLG